jgi:hypothetical protein
LTSIIFVDVPESLLKCLRSFELKCWLVPLVQMPLQAHRRQMVTVLPLLQVLEYPHQQQCVL